MRSNRLRRLLFWWSMPVFLVLGRYTGLRIFYILLFVQLLLLGAVLLVSLWTIHSFRFYQDLEHARAFKGSRVRLHMKIANESLIPLSLMEIGVRIAIPGRRQQVLLSIPPFSEKAFEAELETPYRGVWPVGMKELSITDVFGLTTLRYDMERLTWYHLPELTVLPRLPETAGREEVYDEKLFGDAGIAPASAGDSVTTARPYVEGDALKRVNWKISARYGSLFVKQYDSPARENVLVLIDNCDPDAPEQRRPLWRRLWERQEPELSEELAAQADTACECAVAVIRASLLRGRLATLWCLEPDGRLASLAAADDSRMEEVLQWLAALPFGRRGDCRPLLGQLAGQGSSLVVVSAWADETLKQELESLSAAFSSVSLIAVGDAPRQDGSVTVTGVPVGADVFALFAEEEKKG